MEEQHQRLKEVEEKLEHFKLNQRVTNETKRKLSLDKGQYPTTSKKVRTDPPQIREYKKRSGTVNQGARYEFLMCGLYCLKLITSEEVLDFEMTTNSENCEDFDDIEIDVTFKNNKRRIFLFQLKHKEREELIEQRTLTQIPTSKIKNKFYLPEYLNKVLSLKRHWKGRDVIFILYTNSPIGIGNNSCLPYGYNNYEVPLIAQCLDLEYQNIILNTKGACRGTPIFRFFPRFRHHLHEACQSFYFFTSQKNVKEVEADIQRILEILLKLDIYDSFESFFKTWWSGNFVLTKRDVIFKLTELTLSPFIKTIAQTMERRNEKSELFEEAVMRFGMTIISDLEVNIWSVEDDSFEVGARIQKKFGFTSENKTLWYLGKVPLVVKVEDSNKEAIKSAITLLGEDPQNKKILLVGNISKNEFPNWNVFENLSDLVTNFGNEDFCRKIMNSFKVSLQGREGVTLKDLLDIDPEFSGVINTKELLEMTQTESLIIDKKEHTIPQLHIKRNVSPSSFATNSILYYYDSTDDCVIIFNCDDAFRQKLLSKNRNCVEFDEREEKNYKSCIILSIKNKLTFDQFHEVCNETKSEVYVFQLVSDDHCMLLLKRGNKLLLKKFLMREVLIHEDEIFEQFDNQLRVFCAPPGMGKSRLFQVLSNSCPKDCWSVHVELISCNKLLKRQPSTDELLCYFLRMKKEEDLCQRVKKIFLKNKKIHFFLDGLDEVDQAHVEFLLSFVGYLLKEGFNVWLSSRENMKGRISLKFKIVSITIQEFTQEQQIDYINKRLEGHYEDVEKIQEKIITSANVTSSSKLLGVPLQLYIITEIFINNKEDNNLEDENIFILTKMYDTFFNGKKRFSFQKLKVEDQEEQLPYDFEHYLKLYQIPALHACLDETDLECLNLDKKKHVSFMRRIKNVGDKLGIIRYVTEEDQPVFDHQTYAEYFACIYLRKDKHRGKLLILREKIFSEKYQNLKLILDVMMAEQNPLHLAVIYKNVEQFDKYSVDVEIGDVKDDGGRTPLHLACSYGTKCPKLTNHYKFHRLTREPEVYKKIIHILFEKCRRVFERDSLFNLDAVNYSAKSLCLYCFEKMLEIGIVNFENVEEIVLEYFEKEVLVYYSSRLGYYHLLHEVIRKYPKIVSTETDGLSLLQAAVIGSDDDKIFSPAREVNIPTIDLLMKNGANFDNILEYACEKGYHDMIEVLLKNGAKCPNGNTPLHVIASRSTITEDVIKMFKNINSNYCNTQNYEGSTALHIAIGQEKIDNALNLLKAGVDVNILNHTKENALHVAIKSFHRNKDIRDVIILLARDYHIDHQAKDISGRTPLLLASKCDLDMVKLFIDDIEAVDDYKKNALHYATSTWTDNTEVISFLMASGFDVNSRTQDRVTPLHLACENRQLKNIAKLLESGADVNAVDLYKRNALHYAIDSLVPLAELDLNIIQLLVEGGIDVTAQDEDGVTAVHVACRNEQFECLQKLLDLGVDDNVVDIEGKNALHYAACSPNVSTNLIGSIIDRGFDINARSKKGTTALQYACRYGPLVNVMKLIESGADLRLLDDERNNILHYAVQCFKNIELVEMLIKDYGFDVNAQNCRGTSVLHFACQSNDKKRVGTLLELGANVGAVDQENNNCLHYSTRGQRDYVKDVKMLIETIDINATNKNRQTPLHFACKNNKSNVVRLLFDKGANINAVDEDGLTTLHYAAHCERNNDIILDLLLSSIDVDVTDARRRTPLHFAAMSLCVENVQILKEHGAKIDIVDNDGMNALHYAAQSEYENKEVICLLIESGLDVNSSNRYGETPLHLCCKNGNCNDIEKLIENGADVKAVTSEGRSILHYATFSPNSEIMFIDVLLELKLDINARDKYGASVLHFACENSDFDTIKTLIDNTDIDINARDYRGRTALDYAASARKSDENVIKLLADVGGASDV